MSNTIIKIQTDNLGKKFKYIWALKKISISVAQNEIIGIIGPNGAGKSTLLNLIASNIKPTTGKISFDNQELSTQFEDFRKKVGLFSYYSFLYDDLTGWENLLFWMKLYNVSKDNNKLITDKAIEYKILNWLERPVNELSTGMRKKIDFLRIMLIKPDILLLDEPFSGMDPKNRHFFTQEILKYKSTGTICIASHNLEILTKVCDRVLVLKNGKLIDIIDKTENLLAFENKLKSFFAEEKMEEDK